MNSNDFGRSRIDATNTVAEIQAATLAISQAHRLNIRKLRVNTDLKLIVDAVNGSLPSFQPTADRHEFEELNRAIRTSRMDIRFNYMPSLSGNDGHNEADHLARRGAELPVDQQPMCQ